MIVSFVSDESIFGLDKFWVNKTILAKTYFGLLKSGIEAVHVAGYLCNIHIHYSTDLKTFAPPYLMN